MKEYHKDYHRNNTFNLNTRLIILYFFIFFVTGCAFHIKPSVNQDALGNPSNKLPSKILLVMSDEFVQFNYVASYDGREIRYFWGESLKESFPIYLQNIFSSVLLFDSFKNQDDYDFLVSPQFINTNSYVRPFVFGVETGIKIDFTSKDKSKSFSMIGKGEGQANIYFEGPLKEAGESALNQALIHLREQIYNKQLLFKW